MAVRVWLHRSAPDDVPTPWALELADRCRKFNVLPGPGGAYDQDESLMASMEWAAGVAALFEAEAGWLAAKQARMDLHTRLMTESAEIAEYTNRQETVADV